MEHEIFDYISKQVEHVMTWSMRFLTISDVVTYIVVFITDSESIPVLIAKKDHGLYSYHHGKVYFALLFKVGICTHNIANDFQGISYPKCCMFSSVQH